METSAVNVVLFFSDKNTKLDKEKDSVGGHLKDKNCQKLKFLCSTIERKLLKQQSK
jgi:hypothetical protein